MASPPPPFVSAAGHDGVTLYTPESLRQWRLARQQKQQQHLHSDSNGGALPSHVNNRSRRVATAPTTVSVSAARAADVASLPSDQRRPTGTPVADVADPADARPLRALSQRGAHHHVPYTRVSPSLRAHDRHLGVHAVASLLASGEWSEGSGTALRSPPPLHLPSTSSLVRNMVQENVSANHEQKPMTSPLATAVRGDQQLRDNQRDTEDETQPNTPALDASANQSITSETTSATSEALTCRVGWCTQPPKRHGLCWTHGGEKKCCRVGCGRAATHGEFCEPHHRQLQP